MVLCCLASFTETGKSTAVSRNVQVHEALYNTRDCVEQVVTVPVYQAAQSACKADVLNMQQSLFSQELLDSGQVIGWALSAALVSFSETN